MQPQSMQSVSKPVSALQELSHADKEDIGRVPRTLEVELTRDLVNSCSAGDVVTILGIVKVLSTAAEAGEGLDAAGAVRSSKIQLSHHVAVVHRRLRLHSFACDRLFKADWYSP